jgi:opacity protein-like surface antigen
MKKLRLPLAILLTLVLSAVCSVALAQATWRLGLFLGQRSMDLDVDSAADDVEQQNQIGLTSSFGEIDWPIMLAIDVMTSSNDSSDHFYTYTYQSFGYTVNLDYSLEYDFSTLEVDVGVRRFWFQNKPVVPYVGGGVGIVRFDGDIGLETVGTVDEIPGQRIVVFDPLLDGENADFGYWLNAGFAWQIGERFTLALDTRYTGGAQSRIKTNQGGADFGLPIDELEFDSGGFQAGLMVGYRLGAVGAEPEAVVEEEEDE